MSTKTASAGSTSKAKSRSAAAKKPARAKAPPIRPLSQAEIRRMAEARIGTVTAQSRPLSLGDSQRLVHELQVHQVELEMQNENLRQANDELAALHMRYYELYDFAPVAYFTVGTDRNLVELNFAGARLLGRDRGTLTGRRLAEHVHPSSLAAYDQLVARALTGEAQVEDALVMQPRDGERVYVKAQAKRYHVDEDGGGTFARIVMMDMSALKVANDELANALAKFFKYWRP